MSVTEIGRWKSARSIKSPGE